jgi:hypothetical protein
VELTGHPVVVVGPVDVRLDRGNEPPALGEAAQHHHHFGVEPLMVDVRQARYSVTMPTRATSYRLDPSVKARLERAAAALGSSERALLERLVSEGLDVAEHPGIVYRDGPTGRRAALAVGPDVWEVISALRYTKGPEAKRVRALAEQFGLHPRQIQVAIDFAADHRDAIEAQVAANDAAAEAARQAAQRRAGLMAS